MLPIDWIFHRSINVWLLGDKCDFGRKFLSMAKNNFCRENLYGAQYYNANRFANVEPNAIDDLTLKGSEEYGWGNLELGWRSCLFFSFLII